MQLSSHTALHQFHKITVHIIYENGRLTPPGATPAYNRPPRGNHNSEPDTYLHMGPTPFFCSLSLIIPQKGSKIKHFPGKKSANSLAPAYDRKTPSGSNDCFWPTHKNTHLSVYNLPAKQHRPLHFCTSD